MKRKTFVVSGASGAVGEGIVAELLRSEHHVIAVLRKGSQLGALEDYLNQIGVSANNLKGIINGFQNEDAIKDLRNELPAGSIDAAIASLGGWYHGQKLHEMPLQDMEYAIQGGLFAHLRFAKAMLPLFEQQGFGSYFMINGGASEFAVPHSGIISIVAAAQKMMTQVLFQEFKETPVNIHAVAAFDMVKTRQQASRDDLWLSPREITQYILKLMTNDAHHQFWHKIIEPKDLEVYE